VQYLLGTACLAALFALGKRRRMALVLAGFAAANLAVIAPLYVGGSGLKNAATSAVRFRAMLLNVNADFGDPARVTQAIEDAQPDVLVLEEVSGRWQEMLTRLQVRFPHRVVESRDDNFGIALLSKWPLARADVLYFGDARVPSVFAEVKLEGAVLRVLGTHAVPPGDALRSHWRNQQLAAVAEFARDLSEPVLVLGDLNASPWCSHFRRFVRVSGLRDSAQGWGVQPTWPAGMPWFWIPIDHCLHSPQLSVVARRVGPNVGSDHYPVMVDVVLDRK
jgi:endonuclease/exonuclease/phosphatase (EEP) superfamily protein YafD